MSYQIETTPTFDRAVKRLLKKYRHLKGDLLSLFEALLRSIRQEKILLADHVDGAIKIGGLLQILAADFPEQGILFSSRRVFGRAGRLRPRANGQESKE